MAKSQWEMARPNEAKMYDIIDCGVDYEQLAKDLLSWMSDDEVGDFARQNGYFDELDEEEDDEEENKETADLQLCIDDYEVSNGYTKIKISTSVFDNFVKDTYLTVQLVNEDFPELIYTCVMRKQDNEYIYCDIID